MYVALSRTKFLSKESVRLAIKRERGEEGVVSYMAHRAGFVCIADLTVRT